MWFACGKCGAAKLNQWRITCFCAFAWFFFSQATLHMCECGEWDGCREQRGMSSADMTSRAVQHSCRETLRHWLLAILLTEEGAKEWEKEINCIYFCPWWVKGLNKCVVALNRGCWIKRLVVWTMGSRGAGALMWFSGACLSFFLSSLNLSCVYVFLWKYINYSIKASSLLPPRLFPVLMSDESHYKGKNVFLD